MKTSKRCISPIVATMACWSVLTLPGSAGTGAIVVKGGTILTITNGTITNGEILIVDGKIREVAERVNAPADATTYEAAFVMPGMIDAHSHLALNRMGDRIPGPVTTEWKAAENLRLDDPMLQVALSGGVTATGTRSGSGIIASGQSVAIKIKRVPEVLKAYVDLKMAVRPLINLRPGQTPQTVMGWYPTASEYFRKARNYNEQWQQYRAGKIPAAPKRDERLEAFAAALRGEVMVHVHTHYPSENQMVMKLAREYGFIDRLVFAHAEEVEPMVDVLRGTKVIPVVGPMMIVRYFGDSRSHNIVKELMEAGVTAALQTDNSKEQFKDFREYAAFLVRHGLKEQHGLESITINGAKALMLEDRIGSIEVGKDADLVLLDGHPFDLTADRIERVIVDGVLEYEREAPAQTARPTAVGPFATLAGQFPGTARSYAITNAQIFTVSGAIIENGTLVVRDGRFDAVGEAAAPRDIPVLDAGGRVLVPGWVVARTFPNDWIGDLKYQVMNDEVTEPIVPEANARFAVDPWFPSYAVNREVGITAQNVTPGRLNILGGTGVVVKSVGMDVEAMVRREPSSLVMSLTSETAGYWTRETKRTISVEESGRMLREVLNEARRYGGRPPSSPEYNLRLESLLPALSGAIPVIVHANRELEIRQAMALADEFDLRLVISGGVQAHRLAGELAQAKVPVILGDSGTYTSDIRGGGEGYTCLSPAILTKAGVKVGFFGPGASRRATPTGRLDGEPPLNAAWAFRNGVSEADALRMVTLNPAEMFDVADRIGSIEISKDADFILLDGHPFDYRALPILVAIDGQPVYVNQDAEQQLIHASRGTNATSDGMSTGLRYLMALFVVLAVGGALVWWRRRKQPRSAAGPCT